MKSHMQILLAQTRLKELRAMKYVDLIALPQSISSEIKDGETPIAITTWIDKVDGDNLRVVVQSYNRHGGVMGKMYAEGFRINVVNNISELKEREIYEFL